MTISRRTALKGVGGALTLPLLESATTASQSDSSPPTQSLVVGNPFGAHPGHFFPHDFGRTFSISPTLASQEWLKDRLTIISQTDHNMVNGRGRQVSFLSGVLPVDTVNSWEAEHF